MELKAISRLDWDLGTTDCIRMNKKEWMKELGAKDLLTYRYNLSLDIVIHIIEGIKKWFIA